MRHTGRQHTGCLVALALMALSSCHVYRGESIEGRIVDAVTEQPVANAIVAAFWELRGNQVHPSVVGNLHAAETVTDGDGRYRLPAWGPKMTSSSYVRDTEPTLVVAHREFSVWIGANGSDLRPAPTFSNEVLVSEWAGQKIRLSKRSVDERADEANARQAETYLLLRSSSEPCTWEKVPRLALELVRRGDEARARDIATILPTLEMLHAGGRCSGP